MDFSTKVSANVNTANVNIANANIANANVIVLFKNHTPVFFEKYHFKRDYKLAKMFIYRFFIQQKENTVFFQYSQISRGQNVLD